MDEKITLCGDNCLACPRYNAHTDEERHAVAELWYRIGWRDRIVSNEEIMCSGCSSHKSCTYHLVECIRQHNVAKCSECAAFPCDKITDMLSRSAAYQEKCKGICSPQEYQALSDAFFHKAENLKK